MHTIVAVWTMQFWPLEWTMAIGVQLYSMFKINNKKLSWLSGKSPLKILTSSVVRDCGGGLNLIDYSRQTNLKKIIFFLNKKNLRTVWSSRLHTIQSYNLKKIRILNYAIVVLIFLRLVCMDIRCVNRLDYG